MASVLEEKPFKNLDDVKADIRNCSTFASVSMFACVLFVIIGVIGDTLNTALGLESISWFLLAIVAGLVSIHPQLHVVLAKHLLFGIEENNKEK
jgi:cation transporter-like permease